MRKISWFILFASFLTMPDWVEGRPSIDLSIPKTKVERNELASPPLIPLRQITQQLKRQCSDARPIAERLYSNLVIRRYPALTSQLDVDDRRRLQAAMLGNHPDEARSMLRPLLASPDQSPRKLAAQSVLINIAMSVSLETGTFGKLSRLLDEVENHFRRLSKGGEIWLADLYMIRAYAHFINQDYLRAQENAKDAVISDPQFYDAYALSVAIEAASLSKNKPMTEAACSQQYADLFVKLEQYMRIDPCPSHAVHLQNYLISSIGDINNKPAMLSVTFILAIMASNQRIADEALERFQDSARINLPAKCGAGLVRDLQYLRDKTNTAERDFKKRQLRQ